MPLQFGDLLVQAGYRPIGFLLDRALEISQRFEISLELLDVVACALENSARDERLTPGKNLLESSRLLLLCSWTAAYFRSSVFRSRP